MKNLILFLLVAFSVNAHADTDGTPAADTALKLATDYVYATGLSNIIDDDSAVVITASGENADQFLFTATAKNEGLPDCEIEVLVSKETGLAFQNEIKPCQNLSN